MRFRGFRNFLLIILLIGGNSYAQTQLPKCMLFGFGNCIGTLRFSNGDIYTGEFNYGKPNGKGAFTYGNGDTYSGTVAEGQRHGSGTYTSAADDKYVGQFSEGKFEGVGTYYFLANNRSKGDVYAGEFSSNTFNGQGRYTHANGQVFVGSFVNGRKAVPVVAPETMLAQTEVQRLAEENAKQKAQLESQLEAERRERLAREKQAAAVLVAQAEAQRIAEENAKQKAQLESQLEAERRERLAREKQAAAALVAQAEAQRIAEENAKQKAQLESQLEAERRERLGREKQAAAVLVAKQDVQVAPIASPALAIVVVPAGDKAAPQPEAVLTKLEPVPASVETAQQLYGSQGSAVQAPLAAESRTGELVTAPNERSKWYLTGGVTKSVSTTDYVTCNVSCSRSMNPWGMSLGAGYDLTKYWAFEAEIASVGSETVNYSSAEVKADYYVFMLGGVLSFEIAPNTRLNIGGGYYRALIDSRYSSATKSLSQSYESENSFVSLGAAYQLNYSTSFRLKWSMLDTKQNSIGETDMYQGLGLGIKYNF